MLFLGSSRKWTSITGDARLQMAKGTGYELPNDMINTENEKLTKISIKNEDNLYTKNKGNPEADYFVAGPNMETDRAVSV